MNTKVRNSKYEKHMFTVSDVWDASGSTRSMGGSPMPKLSWHGRDAHATFRISPLLILLLLCPLSAFAQLLTPVNLTTEYLSNPIGMDEARPRFAWTFQSSQPAVRGQAQSAYEIRVASTPALLANGHADLWHSGKTLSNASNQIEYNGLPLGSGRECWWQVRVWNQNNEAGPWSEPAMWASGMLERADWKAQWVGLDSSGMKQTPPMHLVGCQWVWTNARTIADEKSDGYFRGRFVLPEGRTVETAFLAMTASNRFQAYVNGHYVLAGEDRQTLFTRDINFAIHPGENVIAVYAQNDGEFPALAGRLEIHFKHGGVETVDVDNQWKTSEDAPRGWQQPGFEDLTWKPVDALGPVGRQPWGQPTQVDLPLDPAVYLRKSFLIEKKIKRAMLYATALGDYQIHLNGQPLSSEQFSPGFSDYRRRVYYQTYDLTGQLRLGHNALGIVLADGDFAGYWRRSNRSHNYGGEPRAFAQLEIDYADGSSICIPTDETWLASLGPLRQADRITGEVYDARQREGWDQPLYKPSGWIKPKLGLDVPEPLIKSDLAPATHAAETYPAQSIVETIPGNYVVDFGREIAGHVRLHSRAYRGSAVEIRYGNTLDADGSVHVDPALPEASADVYVASNSDPFTYEATFTQNHFRYAEISGLTSQPDLSQVLAVTVYPDLLRTGWFTSNDSYLNQRYNSVLWANRAYALDRPEYFPPANSLSFTDNAASQYYQLLDTLSDESRIADGGVITASSPLDHQPGMRLQDTEPLVIWDLLRIYGDRRIVRRHFAELEGYTKDLREHWQEYAHTDPFFRDAASGSTEDSEMIALAYATHIAHMMAEMSDAIGNPTDNGDYIRMTNDLMHQYQERYLNLRSENSLHTQTGYALALQWGLVPNESHDTIAEQLVRQLDNDQWRTTSGDLGRSQLLFALSDAGRTDAAYRLLAQRSFNDPSAARWLYEDVAGISPMFFGFERIRIRPRISAGLNAAGAVYDSVAGRITCKWHRENGTLHVNVTVPINSVAELDLPTSNVRSVEESGESPRIAPGITFIGTQQNLAIYELRSGDYQFTATP